MRLTILALVAALESPDVWDEREIDVRPVPETIATLREYARALTLNGGVVERVRCCPDASLTRGE